MEKQKQMEMDLVVGAKREHRYNEIIELIGQLTLIEKYIRIRLCNGTLHKDEDALHILLDLHRDAVFEIGMNLNSLKILDSEDEEECVEDDDECDMRAEDDDDECDMRAEDDDDECDMRAEDDDDDCEAIDQYKDVDDEYEFVEPPLITKEVLLEYNFGYHPTQHYCEKDFGDVNVHIQFACDGSVSFCHIKRRCKSSIESWERDDIELTTIRYVYQLQQALELIGADCGDTF